MGQFSQSNTSGDLDCIFSGSGWVAMLTPVLSTCLLSGIFWQWYHPLPFSF
jgi:hypothetical protein